jgi:hypothetical protein
MIDVARSVGGLTLADACNTLGVVAGRAGDPKSARVALARALALTSGDPDYVKVLILGNLSALDLLEGRYEQAEGAARESLALASQLGYGSSRPLNLLGLSAARGGDVSGALSLHRGAFRAFGVPEPDEILRTIRLDEIALTVVGLAGAIVDQHAADAARLLGAAAVVSSPSAFLSVIRRSERDRLAARLREELGEDSYASAEAAGRALSREEALRLIESVALSDPTADTRSTQP